MAACQTHVNHPISCLQSNYDSGRWGHYLCMYYQSHGIDYFLTFGSVGSMITSSCSSGFIHLSTWQVNFRIDFQSAAAKEKMAHNITFVVVAMMLVMASAIPSRNKLQQLLSINRQNVVQQYIGEITAWNLLSTDRIMLMCRSSGHRSCHLGRMLVIIN